MKQYNEAIKSYSIAHNLLEQLIKLNSNDKIIIYEFLNSKVGMGKCLFETGDSKSAMAMYQSVFQVTQEHIDSLIEYSRVLYSIEKYEEAFEILLVIFVKQSRKESILNIKNFFLIRK